MHYLLKFFLCLLISSTAISQNSTTENSSTESTYSYKDSYNRDTPWGSFTKFIEACNENDYESAAIHMDLRSIAKSKRKTEGPILAKKLKFIIDRSFDIDEMNLSNSASGMPKDGLIKTRDRIGQTQINGKKYNFLMDRMWGPKTQVWKFSKSTIKNIEPIYLHVGPGFVGEVLPPIFFEYEFLTLQLWQLLAILLFIPFGLGIAKLITKRIIHILPRIGRSIPEFPKEEDLKALHRPAFLSCTIIIFTIFSYSLNLTLAAEKVLLSGLTTIVVIAVTWFFLRSVDIFADMFQEKLERRELIAASSMIPLGRRFVKIFLSIITGLALLRVYNVDITALLAGLGVGGIAVALAAQKSLENLFSGVALITDQPVRVGDFCRFDQQLGRVEDIGLRSTRIRTLERTVVIIPNREFSQMKLENLSQRDKMQFATVVGLRYETRPDQMRYILSELRKLLLSHPKVLQDRRIRVRFTSFGSYSLDIEVNCYINTKKWFDYLAIREDIMLRVMEIVEECGSSFAFPSKTVYHEPSHALPEDKVQHSLDEFTELKKSGSSPFPDYTPAQYDKLRATLTYPPKGSVTMPQHSSKGRR